MHRKSINTLENLKRYRDISHKEERQLHKVVDRHPMRITPYYASLINWENPDDPLLKMSVPSLEELNISGSYDTSGEGENTKLTGLQHKYSQTALVLTTNKCALYCRYCFRKRLVGLPSDEIAKQFEKAAAYIEQHKEINNVLISGGDPLTLSTSLIERILRRLDAIPHLEFIRIGSKLPVVDPDRISEDKDLLNLLKKYSLPERRIYLVTQFNHAREVTHKSSHAVDKLIRSGVVVNNQSVLLKNVNNNPKTLANLLNALVKIGVNPYYVFQCRPVKRVKHGFQETLYRGYHIVEGAKEMLNGHAKRFKYVMSHRTGKIEIVGITKKDIYFKYHQSKDPKSAGKFFKRKLDKSATWLDDLSDNYFLSGIFEPLKFLFPDKNGPSLFS